MSKQDLVAFLRFAAEHPELKTRLMRHVGYEDFVAIALERGYDLSGLTSSEIRQTVETPDGTQPAPRGREPIGTIGSRGRVECATWPFCQRWPE